VGICLRLFNIAQWQNIPTRAEIAESMNIAGTSYL